MTAPEAVLALLLCAGGLTTARAEELHVGPGRPYGEIRPALAAAADGDTVVIHGGRYAEGPLVIDKQLTVEGVGRPVLDGDETHEIVSVRADKVTLRHLLFRNAGRSAVRDNAALKVEGAADCRVEGNTFENNFFGIYLAGATRATVRDNHLVNTAPAGPLAGNGIHLWKSNEVTIQGNDVRGFRDGIYFEFVTDSVIADNTSEGNLRYGLHFMFSDRCEYARNLFRHNGAGVAVMYSRRVAMDKNTFHDNWGPASFGLLLKDINESRITNNRLVGNTTGAFLQGAGKNLFEGNEFRRNGWAVRLMGDAEENLFSRNTFTGNTFDVATVDAGRGGANTFRENYWGRYAGYDLDRDGFGDVPHHPVGLFTVLAQQNPPVVILLHSALAELIESAERALPAITPSGLSDPRPRVLPW